MSDISMHLSGGPLDGQILHGQPIGKYALVPGEGRYVLVGVLGSNDELSYEWRGHDDDA